MKKIQEKAPIKYSLARHMRCLDPRKMKDEQEKCIADMKEIC